MVSLTLHDLAVSGCPIGIDCRHCVRRAPLTAESVAAKAGDTRTLEQATGLHCSKCRSRTFSAIRHEKRSRVIAFMRNL